jgi:hypothetical protein
MPLTTKKGKMVGAGFALSRVGRERFGALHKICRELFCEEFKEAHGRSIGPKEFVKYFKEKNGEFISHATLFVLERNQNPPEMKTLELIASAKYMKDGAGNPLTISQMVEILAGTRLPVNPNTGKELPYPEVLMLCYGNLDGLMKNVSKIMTSGSNLGPERENLRKAIISTVVRDWLSINLRVNGLTGFISYALDKALESRVDISEDRIRQIAYGDDYPHTFEEVYFFVTILKESDPSIGLSPASCL